ncbi:MAG: hypothetical protein ACLFUS_12210 [Candidatus Sumerlaeia bacterium]
MARIERIRQNIVSRIISDDDWWDGNILQTDDINHGSLEHHFYNQPSGKRRKIVEQLLDLTARDFKE